MSDDDDDFAMDDEEIPESVANAIYRATQELEAVESWISAKPEERSTLLGCAQNFLGCVAFAERKRLRTKQVSQAFRDHSFKILAYIPVDLRISCLLDISSKYPELLEAICYGPISPGFESYHYNVMNSLAPFSRNGLVEEVFTRDRIANVAATVRNAKKRREG